MDPAAEITAVFYLSHAKLLFNDPLQNTVEYPRLLPNNVTWFETRWQYVPCFIAHYRHTSPQFDRTSQYWVAECIPTYNGGPIQADAQR
jgi:hypothetical protein